MFRPTKALIDLAALRHNYQLAQSLSSGGQALPIIKADAYGHGSVEVAKALEELAPAFGVACIEEALELRRAGILKPILILQGVFSADELLVAQRNDFWLMIGSENQVEEIVSSRLDRPLKIWLKIDTGMCRFGVAPELASSLYKRLRDSANVEEEVVLASHFACADECNREETLKQLNLFKTIVKGIDAPWSLANSPALLAWPETRAQWNRPGFMLYGNTPMSEPHTLDADLRPVMSLHSQVISLRTVVAGNSVGYGGTWTAQRDSLIATVTIGYGDGYPRHAKNGTPVLVNGQRAPLAGRVSMDMITVDVTDIEGVGVGDTVTLWGEGLSVNEIAEHADTIGYELLAGMPARIPRVYIDS
jgi:alanine racemase